MTHLQAENVTISLPYRGCNKNCPYCVSKMTNPMKTNKELMVRNIEKLVTISRNCGISTVLFTGKGEPLLNEQSLNDIENLARPFSDYLLEIQTNGMSLIADDSILKFLFKLDFNVIAISVDNKNQIDQLVPIFNKIADMGMVGRMTFNATLMFPVSFKELSDYAIKNKVKQLTIRKIVAPEQSHDLEINDWINKYADQSCYFRLVEEANELIKEKGKLIRTTMNGCRIWDIDGLSYTSFEECLQEYNNSDNIRSLIFQEDGHLYTSWNSYASVIF